MSLLQHDTLHINIKIILTIYAGMVKWKVKIYNNLCLLNGMAKWKIKAYHHLKQHRDRRCRFSCWGWRRDARAWLRFRLQPRDPAASAPRRPHRHACAATARRARPAKLRVASVQKMSWGLNLIAYTKINDVGWLNYITLFKNKMYNVK